MNKHIRIPGEHDTFPMLAFGFLAASIGTTAVRALVNYGRDHIAAGHHGTTYTDETGHRNLTVTSEGVHFSEPAFGTHVLSHDTADEVLGMVSKVEQASKPDENA